MEPARLPLPLLHVVVKLLEELGVCLGRLGRIGQGDDPGEITGVPFTLNFDEELFGRAFAILTFAENDDGLLTAFVQ